MSRLSRSAAAVLSAFTLCLAVPAGTAFADRTPPAAGAGPATTAATAPGTGTRPAAEPGETSPPPAATSRPATTAPRTTGQEAPASTKARSTAPVADVVDVRLSVWFDKSSYTATEPITAHAEVTNTGTVTARSVSLKSSGNLSSTLWSPFFPLGVPIEPGQTVKGTASGYVTTASGPLTITVTAVVSGDQTDVNPADNTVTVSVPVAHPVGSYRGTVYGDRNGNGTMDPGEALAGIKVEVSGGVPYLSYTATTDRDGRFVFPSLPAGSYWTWFTSGDWYVPSRAVEIDEAHDPDVLARAVPVIGDRLAAAMAFTSRSYRYNDVAHLRLTLTDNGPVPLTDLTARCWTTGAGNVATGALAEGGPGVVIRAKTTRTFDLAVRITGEMAAEGYLRVHCLIGAPPAANGSISLAATASIPGGMAPAVTGWLYVFRGINPTEPPWGDPLPGVKVYLRNQLTGAIAARAVSGAGGAFTFHRVPAGLYSVGVVGPWRTVYPADFIVRDGVNGIDPRESYGHRCFVLPGPYQPDPDAATSPPSARPAPAPPRPAAPAATRSHSLAGTGALAETGAEVTWLALGAFLTTMTGAAFVLGAYRSRWR